MAKDTRKLLIESSEFVSKIKLSKGLKESVKLSAGKAGTLIVKNVPCTILNRRNLNGRIYSTELLETAIAEAQEAIASRQLLCAGNEHPDGSFVPPTEASHVVINAYIKKNINVVVEGKREKHDVLFMDLMILNTQNGKNARALFEAECSIGTSIRGLGDLNGDIVENYQLLGVDLVGQPSSGTYSRMPVSESVKVELADEKALTEGFTLTTSSTDVVRDLETAAEVQNRINAAQYGTIVKTSTKVDEELNPKTGATTSITTLETETQDEVASLDQALAMAKRAMTNGVSHIDSITIDNIEEEEDTAKESVQTEGIKGGIAGAIPGAVLGAKVGGPLGALTGGAAGYALGSNIGDDLDDTKESLEQMADQPDTMEMGKDDPKVKVDEGLAGGITGAIAGAAIGHPIAGALAGHTAQELWKNRGGVKSEVSNLAKSAKDIYDASKEQKTINTQQKANAPKIVTYIPQGNPGKFKFWEKSGRVINNPTEKDVWKVIEALRTDWEDKEKYPEWRRAFMALIDAKVPRKMLNFIIPEENSDKVYKDLIKQQESSDSIDEGLAGAILGGAAGALVGHPFIGGAVGSLAQDTLLDDAKVSAVGALDQDFAGDDKIEYEPESKLNENYDDSKLIPYTGDLESDDSYRVHNFIDKFKKSISGNEDDDSNNEYIKAYNLALQLNKADIGKYDTSWSKSFYSLIDANVPWRIVEQALPWTLAKYKENMNDYVKMQQLQQSKDVKNDLTDMFKGNHIDIGGSRYDINSSTAKKYIRTLELTRKYYEVLEELKNKQENNVQNESIKEAKETNPNEGRRFVLKCPAGFVAMDGNALVFKENPKEAIHFIVGKEESGLVHLSGVEKILDTMGVYDVEKYYRKDKKPEIKQNEEKKEGLGPNLIPEAKSEITEDSNTQFTATVKIGGDSTAQTTDTIPVSATDMSSVNAEISNLYDMKVKAADEGQAVDITVFDNINKNNYHYNPETKVLDYIDVQKEAVGDIEQKDKTLTIDITDDTQVEKEFDSQAAASIAKSGLEQGKLDGNVMLSEENARPVKAIAQFIDPAVDNMLLINFISDDDNMLRPIAAMFKHYGYDPIEGENSFKVEISSPQLNILSNENNEHLLNNPVIDWELRGSDDNINEKLYSEPVPGPSDDFVEKPLNDATETVTITLSNIDWDVDSIADLLLNSDKDLTWVEKINALPSKLNVTITADELNSAEDIEALKEILLKSANETSNVVINGATIEGVV